MKKLRRKRKTEYGDAPTVQQLEAELARERDKTLYNRILRSTIYALVTVAAVAVLVATLFLPVLQIYGNSMIPVLNEGDLVVAIKGKSFQTGDILAFHYNNQILVKRVIAQAGDWVDIDEDGNVYVNDTLLDEPYITEKSLEPCDIVLPYQVPDDRLFVIGDHRATSVDSRSSSVGCVEQEQIVGRLLLRIWPLNRFGLLK